MAKAAILCLDATFKTSPRGSYQTLYVHGLTENSDVTKAEWHMLLMAIMTDKEETSYNIIVTTILSAWKRLDLTPKFERLHIDFEPAMQSAFKKLGGAEKLKGCFFHFAQNIYGHARSLGLTRFYLLRGKYTQIRLYMKLLMALPLLSKEDIQLVWKYRLKDFHNYLCPEDYDPFTDGPWPTSQLQKLSTYVEKWINREGSILDLSNLIR
ncbi:hypothetical protein FO519_010390, partial [Halicephalobus sp. NKZ332]